MNAPQRVMLSQRTQCHFSQQSMQHTDPKIELVVRISLSALPIHATVVTHISHALPQHPTRELLSSEHLSGEFFI